MVPWICWEVEERRPSLRPSSSFPAPGDLSLGYQVVDVTGMVAVYMLKSYPENQLCDIVYGDGIVLLLCCSDLLKIRRVKKGKCFFQPGLGLRECMCFFQPIDAKMKPVQQSADLGIMLYDVFDIRNNVPLDTSKKDGNSVVCPSFFHAKMNKGVIEIPRFNSDAVFSLVEKGD